MDGIGNAEKKTQVSFDEWFTHALVPAAERPDDVKLGFGQWLTERFNRERRVMVGEMEAQWQLHHQTLQSEIMEAFSQSLHTDIEKQRTKDPGPCTPQSPPPRLPKTAEVAVVVKGSPMSIVKIAPSPPGLGRTIIKGSPASSIKGSPAPTRTISDPSCSDPTLTPAPPGCSSRWWHRFEPFFAGVILLNALEMLAEAQHEGMDVGFALGVKGYDATANDLFPGAGSIFYAANFLFNIIYTVELVWQLYEKKQYFYRCAWVWIDLCMVPTAWYDILLGSADTSGVAATMVRMLRVLRLLRLIDGMERFEKLHLLIRSIKASFGALGWCLLLIFFTQVISALWLNHQLGSFYADVSQPEVARREVFARFGTASLSLLTMFQVVFANWTQPCYLLVANVSEWYALFFVFYRCVLGFALIRVVSSMFIAETHRICAHDEEMSALRKSADADMHKAQLRELLKGADKSGDGNVSWDELQHMLQNKELATYAEKMHINYLHLTQVFTILKREDDDGVFSVNLEEFVSGALKVGGGASAIDIFAVLQAVDKLAIHVRANAKAVDKLTHDEYELTANVRASSLVVDRLTDDQLKLTAQVRANSKAVDKLTDEQDQAPFQSLFVGGSTTV